MSQPRGSPRQLWEMCFQLSAAEEGTSAMQRQTSAKKKGLQSVLMVGDPKKTPMELNN